MADRVLPSWAEEIKRTYLRGEASVFIVHGNVYDQVLHG
jgi:transitional endoplasmic reticulum ATPase